MRPPLRAITRKICKPADRNSKGCNSAVRLTAYHRIALYREPRKCDRSHPQRKDPVCGNGRSNFPTQRRMRNTVTKRISSAPRIAPLVFQQEPGKFLPAPRTAGMAQHRAGRLAIDSLISGLGATARYTCPMHPEVIQIGPAPVPSAAWHSSPWIP